MDLRRLWGLRGVGRALAVIGVTLVMQGIVTLTIFPVLPVAVVSLWHLGGIPGHLYASVWREYCRSLLPHHPASLLSDPYHVTPFDGLVAADTGLAALIGILMPAYAGAAVARERQKRRLGELVLTRLTPLQILAAKGTAALLPFLIIAVARLTLLSIGYMLDREGPYLQTGGAFAMPVWFLWLAGGPGFAVNVGILLCVSALCRRATAGVLLCYVVALVGLPLGDALATEMANGLPWCSAAPPALLRPWIYAALRVAMLALLLPPALRALSRAGEAEH